MEISIRVPDSIFGGWQWNIGHLRINLMYHTLQCDRRWIFSIQSGWRRFGYLTAGEFADDVAGWHWPWGEYRFTAGRY